MKDFRKYYIIPGSPKDVYLAITTPISIMLWSGEEAVMSTEPGSEFSLWEGTIVGKNLEFEYGKKIVQQWYFGDESAVSIVSFILHEHKKGTSVELIHTNIPDEDYDDIVDGWNGLYFGSLVEFFKE